MELREIQGLYFDETTGKAYRDEEGRDFTGYTFEDARSTVWGVGLFTYRLAPWDFATEETARKMLRPVEGLLNAGETAELGAVAPDTRSGFWQTVFGVRRNVPERLIRISRGESFENFNAGRLASSIARLGQSWALRNFRAEIDRAFRA